MIEFTITHLCHQHAKEFGECIKYFSREAPEVWLRHNLPEKSTLRQFKDIISHYEEIREIIFNFANEATVKRISIINFIANLVSQGRDWNEQLNTLQVGLLKAVLKH